MADDEQAVISSEPTENTENDTVEFPEHGEVLETGEKIVHDKDKDGNVIGWHKEAPKGDNK